MHSNQIFVIFGLSLALLVLIGPTAVRSKHLPHRHKNTTEKLCSKVTFIERRSTYENTNPEHRCKPRPVLIQLNHNISRYVYQPGVAEVQRCSGSCVSCYGNTFVDKHCVPDSENRTIWTVEVQRLTTNELGEVIACDLINVPVENHTACHCVKHEACLDEDREKCHERKNILEPDFLIVKWSESQCRCVTERYHNSTAAAHLQREADRERLAYLQRTTHLQRTVYQPRIA